MNEQQRQFKVGMALNLIANAEPSDDALGYCKIIASAALRQLLEQPEPVQSAERGEPVAWMHPDWLTNYTGHTSPVTTYMVNGWKPLYTTPPAQPAAWVDFDEVAAFCRVAFGRGAGDFNAGIDAMLAELKLREKNWGAVQPEPDMYWDDDDSERPASDSIHELLYERWNNGDLEVGYEVSMTCAKQMEPLTVRVTEINEDTYDIGYEVVKKGGA
jgi:hypothetical protein